MLHTFESPICPCLHQKIAHTVLDFRLGIEKNKNVHVQITHFDHNDKDMMIIGDYVI
jgi:hypothetical protein